MAGIDSAPCHCAVAATSTECAVIVSESSALDEQQQQAEQPLASFEAQRNQVFAMLQPICSVLFRHREDAVQLAKLLNALQGVVAAAEPAGLQGCLDYVLFPLLLAVDSISIVHAADATSESRKAVPLPAMAAHHAAEAALACLAGLLQRTACQQPQQLTNLLQHLLAVVMLPPSATPEELRQLVLMTVGEALSGVPRAPPAMHEALCAEETAPLLGHLISLLLDAADVELKAGGTGSKAVRAAALEALLSLLEALGSPPWASPGAVADALSFFLPGLAVGLGRALVAAGGVATAPRGPAASSEATVAALRALTLVLAICLGDSVVPVEDLRPENESPPVTTGSAALQQLRELSTRAQAGGRAATTADGNATAAEHGAVLAASPVPHSLPKFVDPARMRVERNAEWVHGAASKVEELLSAALLPLLLHPRPAVRQALVSCCTQLLERCSVALGPSAASLLLQLLFSAAQDDWPQVAATARSWLQRHAEEQSADAGSHIAAVLPVAEAVEQHLLGLLEQLPSVLRQGDALGRLHALKLTTCFEVSIQSLLMLVLLAGYSFHQSPCGKNPLIAG